jgi:hypothetical protein
MGHVSNPGSTSPPIILASPNATTIPLILKGAAGQSVDYFEIQDSTSTIVTKVASNGWLIHSGSLQTGQLLTTALFPAGGAHTTWQPNDATHSFIIKGFASQSASLQEWQDSSGGVIASFKLGVGFSLQSGLSIADTASASPFLQVSSATWTAIARSTTQVPFTVKGVASQTANLQEWQNSAGSVQARVDNLGNILSGSIFTINTSSQGRLDNGYGVWFRDINNNGNADVYQFDNVGSLTASAITQRYVSITPTVNQTGTAGYTALLVNVTETAVGSGGGKLVDFQVAGVSKANLTNAGWFTANVVQASSQLVTNNIWWGGGNPGISTTATTIVLDARSGGGGATTLTTIIKGGSSQGSNDLTQWQNSAGTVLSRLDSAGRLGINITTPTALISTGETSSASAERGVIFGQYNTGAQASILHLRKARGSESTPTALGSNDYVGLIYASAFDGSTFITPAALIFKNNGGGIGVGSVPTDVYITSGTASADGTGKIRLCVTSGGQIGLGLNNTSPGAQLGVTADTSTTIVQITKGAASQSSDLHQWQASGGTVLALVDASGFVGTGRVKDLAATGPYLTMGASQMVATPRSATQVPFTVQGFASQTADLQQWQDSGATVKAKIDQAGQFWTPVVSDTTATGTWLQFGSASLTANVRNAANIGLIVKGFTSQTADLQQWQDSTGARVASIGADGSLVVGNTGISFTNAGYSPISRNNATGVITLALQNVSGANFVSVAGHAGSTPLIAKGAASQTANLQEWQDSAGAVVGSYGVDGYVRLGRSGFGADVGVYANGSLWFRTTGNGVSGMFFNSGTFVMSANGNFTLQSGGAGSSVIVKGVASQTADLHQWQSSAATALTSIDKIGRLRAPNVEAVTAAAGANAGTTPPAPVVTGSTDVRGLITWGTGTGPAAGDMVDVTFPTAWAAAPYVTVTPINAATAALLPYVPATTTTGFSINVQAAPAASQANTVYGVQFHVVG